MRDDILIRPAIPADLSSINAIFTELIGAARRQGHRSILANVSADQTPSIRLHEKFGFEKVAHLRQVGQKFNQWFDAVYLQLLLGANSTNSTIWSGDTNDDG